MNQAYSEEQTDKFLEDLRSNDPYRRRLATETIGEKKLANEQLVDVLKMLASQDPNLMVRSAARSTLNQLGIEWSVEHENNASSNEPILMTPPEPVTDLSSFLRRYKQGLWGFFGWFVIASLIAPFSSGLITTPATVICLIGFGLSKTRKGIAGGILIAGTLNFIVSLVRGLTFNASCFIPFYVDAGF